MAPHIHQKQVCIPPAVASMFPSNRPIEMVGDHVELHEVRKHLGNHGIHLQRPQTPLLGPKSKVV